MPRWPPRFTLFPYTTLFRSVKDPAQVKRQYWRESEGERRTALMPFVWTTLVKQGQIYGNPELQSVASVTNGLNFSYPGYSRSEEHTSELQSRRDLVCRLLLE